MKKREVDRRCQREARERKRSHVAYLESLVEHLKQQDTSGQVAALLKQLKKTEEERDVANKTLKDIQQLIQRPSNLDKLSLQGVGTTKAKMDSEHVASTNESTLSTSEAYTPMAVNTEPDPLDIEAIPTRISDLDSFITIPNDDFDLHNIASCPEVVQQSSPGVTDRDFSQSTKANKQHTAASSRSYDWVNPRSSCCCHALVDRQSGQPAVWQGNFWKFVVDVMSERFDWTEGVQPANDVDSEDVPIRAMLEGWDVVAKRAPLHPSWQMLRRIDEALFRPIPRTERLAMLRAMHLLLQYHTEPIAERYKRLPPWYIYRPSQHISHTYAIDYYAWPHFRQRFIFDEHAYCGNGFFRMYQYEMRLLWPFEFRDCYTHDLETGLFKISRLFDERINNIDCWTMGPDFFKRFPELSGAIPGSIRQIPKSLPPATNQTESRLVLQNCPTSAKEMQMASNTIVEEEEEERQRTDLELDAELEQGDWTSLHTTAPSQTFAASNVETHSTQWHSEPAFALPQPAQDCYIQQPVLNPTSSSSSRGWYNLCDFGFDRALMDNAIMDAPMFPFTA
ncbi:uncharacterized protein N0V89_010233 [Didymosphaeria variabile]|uniref:BZIP domain-containing protein n=1 Tax=Didymosphaeria variabile TaxID=1932322 RepID=A0A9W9C8W4_9PLEO|nr:uncharacterized protein N0V89_010233 [Didymosphaeria variabile]KAJ4348854.1 hypothetical protein N0V89_010233 [Didymosphaeria variabile]